MAAHIDSHRTTGQFPDGVSVSYPMGRAWTQDQPNQPWLKGKNYCKTCLDELFDEKNKKIEKLEDNKAAQPMVFMNAGGGGGASSSSSSSSSAASNGVGAFAGQYTKSKVAAGLLGIFLGSLGIHKFYLGGWGWELFTYYFAGPISQALLAS